ncbi:MAG TPA: metal ABC transporter permease [Solirubrobacteraceae bacterium]|nr:metal ABC transporter permease [Solirubrobacteraceae bacterium]
MFSGFMINAWVVATIVAVVAGTVGFFVVLRGSAFVAHAVPNGSFAGAAGASLIGVSTIVGLGVFAVVGAVGIGLLGRRARRDVATALALVVMLGLGALFLSLSAEYAPEIYSLLFGEVLGVSSQEIWPTVGLAGACVAAIGVIYRPLMVSSVVGEVGEARGVSALGMELCFLVVVALATTMTVPVVGTLLIFSLMIGAPAAARALTSSPARAICLSVGIAVLTVWVSIAASYETDYPVGFFVGVLSAASYGGGRAVRVLAARLASLGLAEGGASPG